MTPQELPKTRAELEKWLVEYDACGPAMEWLAKQPAGATLDQLYETCPYGNYLIWVACKAGVDIWTRVLAACDCARTVATAPEDHRALDLAVRRAQGDRTVTAEELKGGATAAVCAAATRYACFAAYVADAADYAADVTGAATYADEAVAAAYAAAARESAGACRVAPVNIVRSRIPYQLLIGGKE